MIIIILQTRAALNMGISIRYATCRDCIGSTTATSLELQLIPMEFKIWHRVDEQ